MNNSQLPANPLANSDHVYGFFEGEERAVKSIGLTKREEFAKAAMIGLCHATSYEGVWQHDAECIARTAVEYADALLKKLEETQ